MCAVSRPDLQLPSAPHLGVHDRPPDPQRLPAMASLRAADAPFAMAMDRERAGWRDPTNRRLLDSQGAYVYHQLCPRRLGDP